MASVSATDARASLPELLNRVAAGEEVTVTRHGQPVAVMVRPDSLRARRAADTLAAADGVRELLLRGRQRPLGGSARITAARAEELVADVRTGRRPR